MLKSVADLPSIAIDKLLSEPTARVFASMAQTENVTKEDES